MFKNNHLAGVLNFRGRSAPSIGGTVITLAAALAAVQRAEQALEAARALAKAAAKHEGKGVRNLFSDGAFVARASAERWADQAREEGVKAGCDLVLSSLNMDASPPYQHLVARLKRPGAMEAQRADFTSSDSSLAEAILAAAARARSDGANERPPPTGKAAQILAAGAKARRPTGSDDE